MGSQKEALALPVDISFEEYCLKHLPFADINAIVGHIDGGDDTFGSLGITNANMMCSLRRRREGVDDCFQDPVESRENTARSIA